MKPAKKALLVAAALLLTAGATIALALPAPEKPVEIKVEGHTKPGVSFSHDAHFKAVPELQKDCKRCHHAITGPDDPDLKHYVCTDCHGLETKDKVVKIRDAMHERNVGKCYGCHFGSKATHRLKCSDCHKD